MTKIGKIYDVPLLLLIPLSLLAPILSFYQYFSHSLLHISLCRCESWCQVCVMTRVCVW